MAGAAAAARVKIVTDSSACLAPADIGRYGLHVVPIQIHLRAGELTDGDPTAARRVYEALERGEPVKSSAPSPLRYLEAIEGAGADSVLVITPAAEFTAMYRSAAVASELAAVHVEVLDSRTAATAEGLVVLAAAQAAATGARLREVVREAEDASRRADLVATIDDLDHIRSSGRVSSVTLGLAEHLGIRPVFRLSQGSVQRLGVTRSTEGALRRIHREWARQGEPQAPAVLHAARPGLARTLGDMIGSATTTEFSPAMGIHTGPGVVGAAWLRDADTPEPDGRSHVAPIG